MKTSITTHWPPAFYWQNVILCWGTASRLDLSKHNNTFSSDFLYQSHNYAVETVAGAVGTHKNTSDCACKTHCGSKNKEENFALCFKNLLRTENSSILKLFQEKFTRKMKGAKNKKNYPKPSPNPDFGAKTEKNTIPWKLSRVKKQGTNESCTILAQLSKSRLFWVSENCNFSSFSSQRCRSRKKCNVIWWQFSHTLKLWSKYTRMSTRWKVRLQKQTNIIANHIK